MAALINALLCNGVERDELTGNHTIKGVFTHLHAPRSNVEFDPPLFLYTSWNCKEGEVLEFTVSITDPSGKLIFENTNVHDPATASYKIAGGRLNGLVFHVEGEHTVTIRSAEGDERHIPITLTIENAQALH